MATLAMAPPVSTGALTESRFATRWGYPTVSSAALTEPREHAFTFSGRAGSVRVIVRNASSPALAQVLPAWVQPTITAFVGIQDLPDNWDSYGGKAINLEMISQALSILGLVMQADSPVPSVVPLADGGLQVEWHRRQQDLEIAFTAGEAPQFFYRNRATGELDEGSVRETDKLIRILGSLV